jgi:hypothetical protein
MASISNVILSTCNERGNIRIEALSVVRWFTEADPDGIASGLVGISGY